MHSIVLNTILSVCMHFLFRASLIQVFIFQVIDDLPRFVLVKEELTCQPTGRLETIKSIHVGTKLELKWVGRVNLPGGQKRFLKLTCGKNVYTLEDKQAVKMTAVTDPLSYDIQQIGRFALLPTTIQFDKAVNAECTRTAKVKPRLKLEDVILGRPLKLLNFETRDIGVAVIKRTCSSRNKVDIVVILKGAGKQTVILPDHHDTDIYENNAFSSNIANKIRRSLYTMTPTQSRPLWLTRHSQPGIHIADLRPL